MAEQFYTLITNTGKAKIANSTVLGTKINLTTVKIGDSNGAYYNPTEDQTDLVNTKWSGTVGGVSIDSENSNWIVVQTILPATVGGFTIREIGIFDTDGDLIAITKCSETYKPVVDEGTTKEVVIKTILEVSNASSITLKVDPTVIIATKAEIAALQTEIDEINTDLEDYTKIDGVVDDTGSANTYVITLSDAPAAYSKYQTFKFIAKTANTGASTLNVNGLGAKALVKDVSVALEAGDILVGQIITAIFDGTNFQIIPDFKTQFGLKAPLANPSFTGSPTAPTQTTTDNSTKLATTAFINNLLASLSSNIIMANDSSYAWRGIKGAMGNTDWWRIGGGATASDGGYLEIATADNGNEPIYVRQYSDIFNTILRTLTLLDSNGNSVFPGTITASGASFVSGNDAIVSLVTTSADTSTFRQKSILSSVNVGGGSSWLFRATRPADGATIDYTLGEGGTETVSVTNKICTTANEPCSKSTNGYKKFADGLIIQWGNIASVNGTATITFPITFPNACVNVIATANNSATSVYPISTYNQTISNFIVRGTTSQAIFWFALGY